jgi:hypothetical protein
MAEGEVVRTGEEMKTAPKVIGNGGESTTKG